MIRQPKSLLAGLLAMLLVGILLVGLDVQERHRFEYSLNSKVTAQLSQIRTRLESEIDANFYLTRGLMAYVSLHSELSHEEFDHLTGDLFQYQTSIRGIALAPDNVVTYIYPLAGNEQAIGLKYEDNPDQWLAVKRAIDSRESVMAGPVNLVQGGVAFINRTPIFTRDEQDGTERYWGLASVVIDKTELFADAGIYDPDLEIRLGIRGSDGLGVFGNLIDGDQAVFEEKPVLMDVTFSGGHWQLAAVPTLGWGAPSPYLWWLRIGGSVLALFVGWVVIAWQRRQYDRRQKLETALKKVEEANDSLVESETFLSAVFENIPNTIFVKTADDLRYVRFNKAGEDLLGVSREQMLGKNDYDLFPESEAQQFIAMDREVIANNKLYDIPEESIYNQHLGTRYVHTKKIPLLDKTGTPNFLLGISEDITERKLAEIEKARLEAQLRQSLKMESIGTLAGGIAHDFNNILGAILGYSEMALEDIPADSPAREPIKQVSKAGRRAQELVRHILSFSRKESRDSLPVEFHVAVRDALKLLRATIPSTIEFDDDDIEEEGYILAHPTQIHQVVMNVCTNAAQSMAETGGVLHVSLARVTLGPDDCIDAPGLSPGDYLRLSISDNGVGIEQSVIDRIFDPYFTTKKVGEGSGMGLAVVLGIVKSYDGGIKVSSEPGKGTIFDLYFPRVEKPALEETIEPASLPTGSGNILIVDDEEALAEVTKMRVERLGYKVTAMTSSGQALELFCSDPAAFDLVITDQTMPGLTGEALARKILKIRPDMPIVLCTGYSAKMDGDEARKAGISAFVLKPVDKWELATTIRTLLDRKESAG